MPKIRRTNAPATQRLRTTTAAMSAVILSACASNAPGPQSTSAPLPVLGMANPASVFCVEQGGQLRMEKTPTGEHGLCMLPDGREIEEWAFFRANHTRP